MEFQSPFDALALPRKLWGRRELLMKPSPAPSKPGVYAWYFRCAPRSVPTSACHAVNLSHLLYVGIAPSGPGSRATLRSRIRTHLGGNASGSTLRLTLGCLLAEELGLRLEPRGNRLTFGTGEDVLSAWLNENAAVVWHEVSEPWSVEPELIAKLQPPLNLEHNAHHPFYPVLSGLRRAHRQGARQLGVRAPKPC